MYIVIPIFVDFFKEWVSQVAINCGNRLLRRLTLTDMTKYFICMWLGRTCISRFLKMINLFFRKMHHEQRLNHQGIAYMHNFGFCFFVFFAFFFSLVKRRWLCPVIYSVTPVSTENTHEHSETVTGSALRNGVVIRQNFQCKYLIRIKLFSPSE